MVIIKWKINEKDIIKEKHILHFEFFILEYLTPCQKTAWIKDGVCDKDEAEFKMEACQFDGGDCCQKSLIGNGICEEANNFASCGNFDGGDCKGKIYIF